nr:hypothetical protein [Azospirillum rugosum]
MTLLQSSIRTVWTLEILLLLRRDAGRAWNAEELIRESRSSTVIVQEALTNLQQSGLAADEPDGRVRYQPASPAFESWVGEIASAYAAQPTAIVKALRSVSSDKIQNFADAFRFRRDE